MIIETFAKSEEDTDLLCNTLNAEAGRFLRSDPHLRCVLLRAQAAINSLEQLVNDEREFSEELKHDMASM